MQTFLPYSDYAKSMAVLDDRRLGNQVWREGITILRGGWSNHPVSKMWRGYEGQLALYLFAGLVELKCRGKDHFHKPWAQEIIAQADPDSRLPPWWVDNLTMINIMLSHRSNLYFKDPEYYAQFACEERVPYYYPYS